MAGFNGNYCLRHITFPRSLREIGKEAFSYCHSLEEVIISENNAVVGWCAFHGCKSLKKITLNNGVSKIKRFAFDDCKQLRDISVAPTVSKITGNVFGYYTKEISSTPVFLSAFALIIPPMGVVNLSIFVLSVA